LKAKVGRLISALVAHQAVDPAVCCCGLEALRKERVATSILLLATQLVDPADLFMSNLERALLVLVAM
jgi:hypothetical protein